MSKIYGLGIAMPMNYKEMMGRLQQLGTSWDPITVKIKCPLLGISVTVNGAGKMEFEGTTDTEKEWLEDNMKVAMMWAAVALLGSLSSRGVTVVGLEEIEKGSHIEHKHTRYRRIKK